MTDLGEVPRSVRQETAAATEPANVATATITMPYIQSNAGVKENPGNGTRFTTIAAHKSIRPWSTDAKPKKKDGSWTGNRGIGVEERMIDSAATLILQCSLNNKRKDAAPHSGSGQFYHQHFVPLPCAAKLLPLQYLRVPVLHAATRSYVLKRIACALNYGQFGVCKLQSQYLPGKF
ncbi:hypothetical protein B0H34DRAFT_678458 [Crassisporium funariophilum]|nr:hypothetical protein B0H34DRAFT_678458 [Crassisporium funariophilum]